jgi:hypothetical protein
LIGRNAVIAEKPVTTATNRQTPAVDASVATPQHAEELLQASRRLDWRFLLPDPRLDRVAYIGPKPTTLVSALKLFATTLKTFGGSEVREADYTRYDIVVVCNPDYRQLRLATDLMRPGGFLYVEACGLLSSRQQFGRLLGQVVTKHKRLWSPQDYISVLKQLRMDGVEAYWFWPNWDAATKIIPLDGPAGLNQAFGLQQSGRGVKGRLMTMGKRWFMHSRLFEKAIPYFGIVAW